VLTLGKEIAVKKLRSAVEREGTHPTRRAPDFERLGDVSQPHAAGFQFAHPRGFDRGRPAFVDTGSLRLGDPLELALALHPSTPR